VLPHLALSPVAIEMLGALVAGLAVPAVLDFDQFVDYFVVLVL
jgi:hypothetical protein